MIEIGEQCRNRWPSILSLFGIDSRYLTGKHGACPLCGDGTDRFRFDDKEGRGTFYCNQCGAGDGMKFIMLKTGLKFFEAAKEIRARLGETTAAPAKPTIDYDAARQRAIDLFTRSFPICQDEAAHYLASRGLPGPYPAALRFNSSISVKGHPSRQYMPALLALVTDADGNPVNVHRTYLENGGKARMDDPRKMMLGKIPAGSAIRLGAHDGRLGIAEGIETALAVKKRFGVTCWSAISTTILSKFIPPPNVRELIIYADNDLNFAGQTAAMELARTVATMKDGPTVEVCVPNVAGTDWADGIKQEAG
jgi:putative DNA primase/helicase